MVPCPASFLLPASLPPSFLSPFSLFFFFFSSLSQNRGTWVQHKLPGASPSAVRIFTSFPLSVRPCFLVGMSVLVGVSEFGGSKGCSPLAVSSKRVHLATHWDLPPWVAPTCPCSSGLRDPLSSVLKRSQGLFLR